MDKLKEHFKDLEFEEDTHTYSVKGETLNTSVSGLIEEFVVPFDADTISENYAKKVGKTQEEVLQEWEKTNREACEKGTKVHKFAEDYALNRKLKPSNGAEKAVVKFWKELPKHIETLALEAQMYHLTYPFAGTADLVLYNAKTDKYIIADYKTNKDIFKNFKGQKMLHPFNKLLDNPYNHYQLQLSFYQILIEQAGLEVERRIIIWLRDSGEYEMYDTKDYTKKLKKLLSENAFTLCF